MSPPVFAQVQVTDVGGRDNVLLGILAVAIASIVVAVITAVSTIFVAYLTNKSTGRIQDVSAKVDDTSRKVDQVHTLVNSNLTTALENELAARQESLVLMTAATRGDVADDEVSAALGGIRNRIALLEGQLSARYAADKAAQADRESRVIRTAESGEADATTSGPRP